METLFDKNFIFIFFFAMISIYNYSELKEYQRMAIIYISVYALMLLNIVKLELAFLLLIVSLFCFFEIFTADEVKFKILVNPIYKIVDCMYISFFQYSFGGICCSLLLLKVKSICYFEDYKLIFEILSFLFMIWTLTAMLQQKYVVHTFGEMYKIFTYYPINKVKFNKKLDEACNILISIEDKKYLEREAYSFFSVKYIKNLLNNKIHSQTSKKNFYKIFLVGASCIKNIFDESRGYSTIPMQLIRSLGIKRGYNYKYRRKIFEILYCGMFFKGIERMLNEDQVRQRQYFKKYLIYILNYS